MKEENLENYLSKLKKILQNYKEYLMEGKSNLFQHVFIDLTVLLVPRIISIFGGGGGNRSFVSLRSLT